MTKFKISIGVILTFLAALLAPTLALAAQASSDVELLPPELFQAGTIGAVATFIAAAVFALIEKFMGPFGWAAKLARLDQVLEGYIRGGLVKLVSLKPELATKGLSVDVGNVMIAQIARDVVRVAPGWMLRFAGGKDEVEAKIRNRLPKVLQDLKLPALPLPQ